MKFKVTIRLKNGEVRILHNVTIISRDLGWGGTDLIGFTFEDWSWQNIRALEVDNLLCEVENDEY